MKGPKFLKNLAKRLSRKEIQTCPERMQRFGPWERTEGLDMWRRVGPDRKCSFCGSMHPADFLHVLDVIIEEEVDGTTVEQSDKSHKIYIRREDIKNAGEGAIKFYTYHLQGMAPGDIEELNVRYKIALKISKQRLHKWLEKNI